MTVQAVFYTIGAVYIVITSWVVQAWPMLLLCGATGIYHNLLTFDIIAIAAAVPCVVSWIAMSMYLPESPRFLLANNRAREAKVPIAQ